MVFQLTGSTGTCLLQFVSEVRVSARRELIIDQRAEADGSLNLRLVYIAISRPAREPKQDLVLNIAIEGRERGS